MTDILDDIDAALEAAEEQLLRELTRASNAETGDYCEIDPNIADGLQDIVAELHERLRNSGDRVNLQLITERHEVLYERIGVVRQLLAARIPATLVGEAHQGAEARRELLEQRVIRQRREAERQSPPENTGLPGGLRGLFDHEPSEQEMLRNRVNVTPEEAEQLAPEQDYLDKGIYSASRELAMIASLLRGGTLDTPPGGARERAVFKARELSHRMPLVNKSPVRPREPQPRAENPDKSAKPDIAQTPEDIRRKLGARRNPAGSTGKAVFAARDISGEPPTAESQPEEQAAPAQPAGKAVFAAKDLAHAQPEQFYGRKRREASEEETEKEDKPRSGRAVFEARDLADPPFPRKN